LGASSVALEPLLVICGPTAAGKSGVAMALARHLAASIIVADSRQIYRGFDIGTAKPTAEHRALVPHAGLDLAAPTERFSAYRWAAAAERSICVARAAGRVPLVVGGAGFYIRALVHPVTSRAPTGEPRYEPRYLVLDPGAILRDWVRARVEQMLALGWLDEVRALANDVGPEAPAWQASGYAPMRAHAAGLLSRSDAIEATVVATRQYAKRQRTWFRHQLPKTGVVRLNPEAPDTMDRVVAWTAQ
jgi:tRNA dimethylallyltransferase